MEASGVFSLRLATFQHHRSFWESGVVPALLPSHIQANDGVKTLRLIEASRLTGAFIGVSDSFLRCSEDKAGIWPEGVRSQVDAEADVSSRIPFV